MVKRDNYMKKTEKNKSIKGITQIHEDKLVVQKSNPLTSLWQSELTLYEFKILDIYLSRINSHYPERRQVEITRKEFEEVFGISKFNIKELDFRLEHLIKQAVKITDSSYKRGFSWVSLFEEAKVEYDDDGVQTVYLECTQKAMKYFFNIDNLGYFRYKLQCVKDMKSRYTYILFSYLERHRNMGLNWTVTLDELKSHLHCEAERYNQFKFFNSEVLKKCQKEIHEKTDCKYTYEPVKKGRKVVAICFTLEPLHITLFNNKLEQQISLDNDPIDFLSGACCGEFNREQMDVIFSIISTKNLPENPDGIDFARYHYLDRMYRTMQLAASKKLIKHRFDYFLAMLKNEK